MKICFAADFFSIKLNSNQWAIIYTFILLMQSENPKFFFRNTSKACQQSMFFKDFVCVIKPFTIFNLFLFRVFSLSCYHMVVLWRFSTKIKKKINTKSKQKHEIVNKNIYLMLDLLRIYYVLITLKVWCVICHTINMIMFNRHVPVQIYL